MENTYLALIATVLIFGVLMLNSLYSIYHSDKSSLLDTDKLKWVRNKIYGCDNLSIGNSFWQDFLSTFPEDNYYGNTTNMIKKNSWFDAVQFRDFSINEHSFERKSRCFNSLTMAQKEPEQKL